LIVLMVGSRLRLYDNRIDINGYVTSSLEELAKETCYDSTSH